VREFICPQALCRYRRRRRPPTRFYVLDERSAKTKKKLFTQDAAVTSADGDAVNFRFDPAAGDAARCKTPCKDA